MRDGDYLLGDRQCETLAPVAFTTEAIPECIQIDMGAMGCYNLNQIGQQSELLKRRW
jgi:hypothetical protein